MQNKTEEMCEYIIDNDVDICGITATWLTEKSAIWDKVALGDLTPAGYKLLHAPCPKTQNKARGGGDAVIYRERFQIKQQKVNCYKSFEYIEVLLTTRA